MKRSWKLTFLIGIACLLAACSEPEGGTTVPLTRTLVPTETMMVTAVPPLPTPTQTATNGNDYGRAAVATQQIQF